MLRPRRVEKGVDLAFDFGHFGEDHKRHVACLGCRDGTATPPFKIWIGTPWAFICSQHGAGQSANHLDQCPSCILSV